MWLKRCNIWRINGEYRLILTSMMSSCTLQLSTNCTFRIPIRHEKCKLKSARHSKSLARSLSMTLQSRTTPKQFLAKNSSDALFFLPVRPTQLQPTDDIKPDGLRNCLQFLHSYLLNSKLLISMHFKCMQSLLKNVRKWLSFTKKKPTPKM